MSETAKPIIVKHKLKIRNIIFVFDLDSDPIIIIIHLKVIGEQIVALEKDIEIVMITIVDSLALTDLDRLVIIKYHFLLFYFIVLMTHFYFVRVPLNTHRICLDFSFYQFVLLVQEMQILFEIEVNGPVSEQFLLPGHILFIV